MIGFAFMLAATVTQAPDPVNLFARETQRSFGGFYQATEVRRMESDGKTILGYETCPIDRNFAVEKLDGPDSEYDIIAGGKVVCGDDRLLRLLVAIADNEGFGSNHRENWFRLLGRNDTGTTNLDYPVLVHPRAFMTVALICDFCEIHPLIYAVRIRNFPDVERDRGGFHFIIGEGECKEVPVVLRIHEKLLQNEDYRRAYADLVSEACVRTNGEFSARAINHRIDRRIAKIREAAGSDIDVSAEIAKLEATRRKMLERSRNYVARCSLAKELRIPAPLAVNAKAEPLPAYGRYRGRMELRLLGGSGRIYYSDVGCDPRDDDGFVSPMAIKYSGPFEVQGRCRLLARVLTDDGQWSPLEMVNLNLE